MAEKPEKPAGVSDLAAVAALVTPFIAALGALAVTGTIGRVQRNEPVLISIGLFLVLGAGALWMIAGQLSRGNVSRLLRIGACVAALAGFVVGCYAAISTANDQSRPEIDAKLSDDARRLTATVSASSLGTEDRLAVVVDSFNRENPNLHVPVYTAYEGPDADGNVEFTVSTILPKGPYTDVGIQAFTGSEAQCDDQQKTKQRIRAEGLGSGTGCVVLPIIAK